MKVDYNIHDIIEQGLIRIYFQCILSHHKDFPRSLEVFVKGIHPIDGANIHPTELFERASDQGCLYELNQRMVERSIESFKRFYDQEDAILLYINIHESLVREGAVTVEWLSKITTANGIPNGVIAFDITAYDQLSVEEVKSFIRASRQSGFYISIDDIGKNYFNLDRILVYNPDIIKINQQFLEKLPLESYRDLLVKQVSHLAHEMGIIVVVTGIETEAELQEAYKRGAQYFQGYYLKEPLVVEDHELEATLAISGLPEGFFIEKNTIDVNKSRANMNRLVLLLKHLEDRSVQLSDQNQDQAFNRLFYRYPFVQNAWALNMEGIQVTKGIVNKEGFRKRNAGIFRVFDVGHDFSQEEFYRIITSGALDMWITKPYISLLNNQVCVSTSSYITSKEGNRYILCLEVDYEMFENISKEDLYLSE